MMRFQAPHPVFRRLRTWIVLFITSVLLLRFWIREGSRPLLNTSAHRVSAPDHAELYRLKGDDLVAAAGKLCRAHGWRPFSPATASGQRARARKVYDLFMIGSELEWLEIRLNTTYDHVDHFVLVEASQTFTGLPKPLTIKENWDRFKPYHDKIIYHELQYPPDFHPPRPWDREDLQRDAMLLQVFPSLPLSASPQKGDVLVVADVDEIVRPETLLVLRHCSFPPRLTLRSRFHYYSFSLLHRGPEWQHPQATFYTGDLSTTIPPVNLRNGDGGLQPLIYFDKADLWNSGWHCSYCYDSIERMLRKMASTSHVGQNRPEFRDRARMAQRVREGKDVWDREGQFYDRLENNTDVPPLLLERKEEFGYLLDRSGESAGFKDYPP